jgi:hypothetical protein
LLSYWKQYLAILPFLMISLNSATAMSQ